MLKIIIVDSLVNLHVFNIVQIVVAHMIFKGLIGLTMMSLLNLRYVFISFGD